MQLHAKALAEVGVGLDELCRDGSDPKVVEGIVAHLYNSVVLEDTLLGVFDRVAFEPSFLTTAVLLCAAIMEAMPVFTFTIEGSGLRFWQLILVVWKTRIFEEIESEREVCISLFWQCCSLLKHATPEAMYGCVWA